MSRFSKYIRSSQRTNKNEKEIKQIANVVFKLSCWL